MKDREVEGRPHANPRDSRGAGVHRLAYRPSASWDDLTPPRLLSAEERTPPLAPWGLGDELPAVEPGLEDKEIYLCVACWEWHVDASCAGPRRRVG